MITVGSKKRTNLPEICHCKFYYDNIISDVSVFNYFALRYPDVILSLFTSTDKFKMIIIL